jgi:hypothetical protein
MKASKALIALINDTALKIHWCVAGGSVAAKEGVIG